MILPTSENLNVGQIPLLKLDAAYSPFEYEQPWDLTCYATFEDRFPHLLCPKPPLDITEQVTIFQKPRGYGKTMQASRLQGCFIQLPSVITRIKTFEKWRDWVLASVRESCEARQYSTGVGCDDAEVSSFIQRLIEEEKCA